MAEDNRKKNYGKGTLTPTKGIRKPGAARGRTETSGGSASAAQRGAEARRQKQMSAGASSAAAAQSAAAQRTKKKKNAGLRVPGQGYTRSAAELAAAQHTAAAAAGNKRGAAAGKNAKKKKNGKIKKKYSVPLIMIGITFLIAITFFSSYLSYTYLVDKYKNPLDADSIYIDPDTAVKFRIEKGMSTKEIADTLYDMGLIKNKFIYSFLSKFNGFDNTYKAGTYTLCDGLSYDEIMVKLSGTPETVKVTFPEGFTTEQIAARLEANNVVSAEDFLKAVDTVDTSSYKFIRALSENRDYRLDGYLFPDTYEFDVRADVETVIYKMLNRFDEVYKPSYYDKAEELGLSIDEVITLASIIEREAKLESDREIISGVFYNRLQSSDPDMKYMQSCATVRYVYKKLYNEDIIEITKEHEKVEDPYNTYRYPGLPPGAICSPGLASIEAALNPQKHDFYYFVAKTDGSGGHIFSRTYEEHLAAQESVRQ